MTVQRCGEGDLFIADALSPRLTRCNSEKLSARSLWMILPTSSLQIIMESLWAPGMYMQMIESLNESGEYLSVIKNR